jgi:hypothetical protein
MELREAESASETSLNLYETIWRNIPKDSNCYTRCSEKMKSHMIHNFSRETDINNEARQSVQSILMLIIEFEISNTTLECSPLKCYSRYILFINTISTAPLIARQLKWKHNYKWSVDKDLEGGSRGLSGYSTREFVLRDGNPRQYLAKISKLIFCFSLLSLICL